MTNHTQVKFNFDKLIREKEFLLEKLKSDIERVKYGDYKDKDTIVKELEMQIIVLTSEIDKTRLLMNEVTDVSPIFEEYDEEKEQEWLRNRKSGKSNYVQESNPPDILETFNKLALKYPETTSYNNEVISKAISNQGKLHVNSDNDYVNLGNNIEDQNLYKSNLEKVNGNVNIIKNSKSNISSSKSILKKSNYSSNEVKDEHRKVSFVCKKSDNGDASKNIYFNYSNQPSVASIKCDSIQNIDFNMMNPGDIVNFEKVKTSQCKITQPRKSLMSNVFERKPLI